jgi:S-DNA-T family DNA segregation ATPase FtsK/SpoIIIE
VARQIPESGGKATGAAPRKSAPGASTGRSRLWRDLSLIAIAPLLLYLLASLVSHSPQDPGWSQSGSVVAPVHNIGGLAGAWLADVLLQLFGYSAFMLPVVLGWVAWLALFPQEGEGEADLGGAAPDRPVGFLIALTGLLHLRLFGRCRPRRRHPRQAGRAVLLAGFGRSAQPVPGRAAAGSMTLATGLSWLWLMDRSACGCCAVRPRAGRPRRPTNGRRPARCARSARKCARSMPNSAPSASR